MRTISLLLHRRPELFEAGIAALIECQDLDKFDHLVISVDASEGTESGHCAALAKGVGQMLASEKIISCSVLERDNNLGVAKHPLAVMDLVFGELGSQLNVALEDDALVKPDLLRMCLWWEANRELESPDSMLICGCNHKVRPEHPDFVDDPSLLCEASGTTSPFCWATTPDNWAKMRECWNFKVVPPTGFDWSLTLAMRINRKIALHPMVSRCQNVGREKGVHDTHETFDSMQLGLRYQEEEYHGPYQVGRRYPRENLEIEDWMLPEIDRMVRDNVSIGRW